MDPVRSARFALLVAILAIVLPVCGGTVAVSFDWKGGAPAARVDVVFTRAGVAETKTLTVTRFDQPALVELADASWAIEAKADHYWHAPRTVVLTAGGTTPEPLLLTLQPAGVISGTLSAERAPSGLTVRFDGLAAGDQPLHGETACAMAERTFTCTAPAGVLDLRLHAPGHVTRFFFQQRVAANGNTKVGEVKLVPGQMIVGRVEVPRGIRDASGVVVLVKPVESGPRKETIILQQNAIVEKNGLFHLDGVSPGLYTVTAAAPGGLVSDVIEVPVRALTETELREPLVLYPALRLALEIMPPQAPDRTPWRVRISKSSDDGVVDDLIATDASGEGRWSTARLRSGRYTLSVEQANGDVWHREMVGVGDSDQVRRLDLAAQPVSGTVKLGDVPLEAKLTFYRGGHSVHTMSESDGTFFLSLPNRELKGWSVTVESSAPDVHRELDDLELRELPDGQRSIDVRLPATVMTGRVVDEKGAAAPWALLTIRRLGRDPHEFQTPAGPDGTFQLHALEEGEHELIAITGLAQSDPLTVKCCADEDEIRIVVKRQRNLTGRVVSAFGPVGGARLIIQPSTARQHDPVHPLTTQPDGTFSYPLAASAGELDLYVAAPGFAFTMDHIRYQPGKFLVTIDHRAGALTLSGKGSWQFAALVQDGAVIDPALLAMHAGGQANMTKDGWSLTIARMEPGPYALCSVAAANRAAFRLSNGAAGGRCVSGHLPPGGTLSLTAPE